jgi:hypothetical protein
MKNIISSIFAGTTIGIVTILLFVLSLAINVALWTGVTALALWLLSMAFGFTWSWWWALAIGVTLMLVKWFMFPSGSKD